MNDITLTMSYDDITSVEAAAEPAAPSLIALTVCMASWPEQNIAKAYADPASKCVARCRPHHCMPARAMVAPVQGVCTTC